MSIEQDVEDISSFSSIESYKPEPFVGQGIARENTDELEFQSNLKDAQSHTSEKFQEEQVDPLKQVQTNDSFWSFRSVSNTSRTSSKNLKKQRSRDIERIVTQNAMLGKAETVDSLRATGLDLTKRAVPDINSPISHESKLIDESKFETDTGLIKTKTLETLNRSNTRNSSSKRKILGNDNSNTSGLDPERMNMVVERNRKKLEKYQQHKKEKGLKGFFYKIFD
ncbi:hypothetical protein KAFR_0C01920 [Kazachstania africana CBS 2517]|uniref:Uncharacterized protein n=1 Tax=Kazachstania africana (strain ATCC 22294 / BCRC 22015 / CBS 2517 / CECT 1963 / NBRC 1671 / NRRL Y-8276) TaxID=1071382 RepID=H2AS35_KAZAF|nr:hypothetical protein KAFR_0C01920 [Kazachstania africana CBS 2517]CCF57185.1 hypothetical protein KAFR_0C01920 [Kazachstania africana CBS 2517]